MSHFVVPISSVDKRDIDVVGKYAGELGELHRIGIPIPEGFVVTTSCFNQFLIENNLTSDSAEKQIMRAPLSGNIVREIFKAYSHLDGMFKDSMVTVTSSSPFSSFKNIHYESKGDANLILKIKEIWGSQFNKDSSGDKDIAVLVQRKIESEKSGTLFTQDPHTNDETIIHIKHKNMSSHYSISKRNLEIIFKGHLSKAKSSHKISDQEAIELAAIGKKLEHYLYFPQEVKFSIVKNKIYILDTKPIMRTVTTPVIKTVAAPVSYDNLPYISYKPRNKREVLLKGVSNFPGIVTGQVRILSSLNDLKNLVPRQIIVASRIDADLFPMIKKVRALITEDVSLAGADKIIYAHVVAKPAIFNVKNATKILRTGNIVTVDGGRGEIYKGGVH